MCWPCFDAEDTFDEVAEIENDPRPWFRKQEAKRHVAMLKAEEERGK
jgi:hypothetical protein